MIKKLFILNILLFLPIYSSLETLQSSEVIKTTIIVTNLALLLKTEHPCPKATAWSYLAITAALSNNSALGTLATACALSKAVKRKEFNLNISHHNLNMAK